MIYNLFLIIIQLWKYFEEAKKCLRPAAFGRPADASACCIKYDDK